MTTPAIRVEGLGKRYRLTQGQQRENYRTLRESLGGLLTAPFRKRGFVEEFWALNDVSFDVQPGEVVGVIGRNGAGKSTLLKILSRITKPTRGHIDINGRVGSLLEVGTGFHPELTGRENVFLNGSILGMSRREITAKFDEIVAFAEVEKFLDTPVKRYSSGMYVRLAFAVAAHLEPEILIVDEVLAVGDAEFQKKCLGKMGDVAKNGRTVLLVTHQMDAVRRLCENAILIEKGRIKSHGKTEQVLDTYLSAGPSVAGPGEWVLLEKSPRSGDGDAKFEKIRYAGARPDNQISEDGKITFELAIFSKSQMTATSVAVVFFDRSGTKLVNADSLKIGKSARLAPGLNSIGVVIESLHLTAGIYNIGLWMAFDDCVHDYIPEAMLLEVLPKETEKYSNRPGGDGNVTCDFQMMQLIV